MFYKELFAYGVGNVVTSFFHGFPLCVALSRCAVVEGTGGKTQVTSTLIVNKAEFLILLLNVGYLDRRNYSIDHSTYCYFSRWTAFSYFAKRLFSFNHCYCNEEYAFTNETTTYTMAYQQAGIFSLDHNFFRCCTFGC